MTSNVMTGEERDRAKGVGADAVFRSKRYRTLRDEYVFKALDGVVDAMKGAKMPNPYDGRILAASAAVLIRHDEKMLGILRKRKVKAIVEGDQAGREELFQLIGLRIAEQFLEARKGDIPEEETLTSPEGMLDTLEGLYADMQEAGKQMTDESVLEDELKLSLPDMPSDSNIARPLIEEAIHRYETLVPEAETNGKLPDEVETRAIAKAAFLRLAVDDLKELVEKEGIEGVSTRDAMAKALGDRYASELDEVARLTLRDEKGDPVFAYVSRLLPLTAAPDIEAAKEAFESLENRYFEVKPTVFFVFGSATRSQDGNRLTITGKIRSFSAMPVQVGGETKLNPRPREDDITVVLQGDQPWATVTARRSADLPFVGAILRRSGEVVPAAGVAVPDPFPDTPYNTWDPRSLWILDLIRRDLQAPNLKLDNTVMANFDSPKQKTDESEDAEEGPTPRLASVRLKGQLLHDHPEVCARIVSRAHLKEVEFTVRKVVDEAQGFANLIRVRLAWERDHIAIFSGAHGGTIDGDLHRQLVRFARDAVARPLGSDLSYILARIKSRAGETEGGDGAESVFDEDAEAGSSDGDPSTQVVP